MTKIIPLTQGKVAIVDDADFEWLNQWKWNFNGRYVCRSVGLFLHRTKIRIHRQIMSAPADMQVDHINGNPLDNRRENLRICTPAQNTCNRKAVVNSKSGYKGVTKKNSSRKWIPEIRKDGKKLYLGSYDTPEEAAKAYDKAAKEIFGEFAKLNFPDKDP